MNIIDKLLEKHIKPIQNEILEKTSKHIDDKTESLNSNIQMLGEKITRLDENIEKINESIKEVKEPSLNKLNYKVKQPFQYSVQIRNEPSKTIENTSTALEQVKKLTDDFYDEMYSFKNLPFILRFLFLIGFFGFGILTFFVIHDASNFEHSFPLICISISTSCIIGLKEYTEKYIIRNYNKKNGSNYSDLYQIRTIWMKNRINNQNFQMVANKLIGWKKIQDRYSNDASFNWRKLTYDNQGKMRVIALTIAFCSISTAIILQFSKTVSFEDLVIQLVTNGFYIGFALFLIIPLFYYFSYMGTMLIRIFDYIFGMIFTQKKLSELRFNQLILFLTNHQNLNLSNGQNDN